MEVNRRTLLRAATALAATPLLACGDSEDTSSDERANSVAPADKMGAATTNAVVSGKLFWTTEIGNGRVMGIANGEVKQFKGIPYGAPTGGANRYMPPKKPASWAGVRECFSHGQISPQVPDSLESEYGRVINWDQHPGGMGEDCLCLNVWTPSLERNAKKAVLVSFHGGGWASGSGNSLGFDGAMMAHTQDVVDGALKPRPLSWSPNSHWTD